MHIPAAPQVESFFDERTGTLSHVVHAGEGSAAAVIDSVAGLDAASGTLDHMAADRLVAFVQARSLSVAWHLETHIHADHLSAAPYLKARLGGRIGIGERVHEVQEHWGKLFNAGLDGQPFDRLFSDGEMFRIGALRAQVLASPGHTPADIVYLVEGGHVFAGDTLFAPDIGSARADFPGGDARALYRSARRLLALPPETRVYLCHDYPPSGRAERTWVSVAEQRAENKHLNDNVTEGEFVAMRRARDATLSVPALMLPSLQVNLRAGRLPNPEANGIAYLKIPLAPAGGRAGSHAPALEQRS